MMNVYVVMKAVWKDYCSYSGDPEEVDICDVYSSKNTAIYCVEKLVTDRYAYSLSKYHEEPIIEIAESDVYEKIVWDGDKNGYERYWIEEKVLKGARND